MREFSDGEGGRWEATVREESGPDYKGRFYLVLRPAGGGDDDEVALTEIRWNSRRTAEGSLEQIHEIELRRRLRYALERHDRPAARSP